MKDVIFVFEKPDIPSALVLQQRFNSSEVWVFDPHLLDDLVHAKVQNARYINCESQFRVPEFFAQSQREAIEVEHDISNQLKDASGTLSVNFWQHLSWFFLRGTLNGYAQLWDTLLSSEVEDVYFHVPLYDRPALFYLPSFLPAVMLMERLAARGIPFKAYAHSTITQSPRFLPANVGCTSSGPIDVFLHVPTCSYDSAFYEAELVATKRKVLKFKSQIWNVEMPSFDQATLVHDTEVLRTLDQSTQLHIAESTQAIESWLGLYFQKFIRTVSYAHRQARHIAEQYRAQLIFYNFLEKRFGQGLPKRLVLSNHDAGLHGPFLSFAQKHDIPVVMLPHAKVFNFPVASPYTNIVAAVHPIQGGGVSNLDGKNLHAHTVCYPSSLTYTYRAPERLRSIGLILNKFSADGMSLVDTNTYLDGLREIRHWCQRRGIKLRIRLKPGGACIIWLMGQLGLTLEDLNANMHIQIVDFASANDICLMYDAPTSGAAEILRCAIPLLAVVPRTLGDIEDRIVSNEIVPRVSVAIALDQLDNFQSDPVSLLAFRNVQFRRYADRALNAVPLRTLF